MRMLIPKNRLRLLPVFSSGDPSAMTTKKIGNRRRELLASAIQKTETDGLVTADDLISILYVPSNNSGLYMFFQHAVHLVTVERIDIKMSPKNFNFIFNNPGHDDVLEALHTQLPSVLLVLAHQSLVLYERNAHK